MTMLEDEQIDRERRITMHEGGTLTEVEPLCQADLFLLRSMAVKAITDKGTKWRHNGQGMLQGYLFEGSINEARVHIWHPELRKEGIFDNGLIHDHRFHMRSSVILGAVRHIEMQLQRVNKVEANLDGETGTLYELTSARKANKATGSGFHMEPTRLAGYMKPLGRVFNIKNAVYTFPRFRFHKAFTTEPLTVTIVIKTSQVDTKARLLDQSDKGPLINSFDNTLGRSEFQHILDQTATALRTAK